MSWTDEKVSDLMRLWDAGYSASAIGRQIGMSKNAVIGKAHRLGLKPRPSPIKRSVVKILPEPTPLRPTLVDPTPMPLRPEPSLAERANGPKCRWPIGDPGETSFHFCELPSIPGKPYCSEHCARAYITRSRTAAA